MGRGKEEPRGTLAMLQEFLAENGQILLEQAASLGEGVQETLLSAGRGVEEQIATVLRSIEERLSERLDGLVSGLAISFRRDLDRLRDRTRAVENRLSDVPREGVREMIAPLQGLASGATERAAAAPTRRAETASSASMAHVCATRSRARMAAARTINARSRR